MCATCGCNDLERAAHGDHHDDHHHDDHDHHHDHAHPHHHAGAPWAARAPARIDLEVDLLAKNDRLATTLRAAWAEQRLLALNLLGGPGAGKTSLLEHTIRALGREAPVSVLEGDQETARDAERVRAAGARAEQINTGTGCHLDAAMVQSGVHALAPPAGSVLFLENVGNLVCPALFDLGERAKVVLLSVTEGEDKPLKYPHVFRAARVLVLSKVDLLPHLDFDVDRCLRHARQVNPRLTIFRTSARTGEGIGSWCQWVRDELAAVGDRS
jgi:hydrogenase nickel incorporation protein HypB